MLGLFFSLECGSKLFSQPLQRATTGPPSLGSTEGVETDGRGAYVTQHAQEASRWEKKMHREEQKEGGKEDKESAFERCFQLWEEGPHIVRATARKKRSCRSETQRGRKNLSSLLSGSEVEGMCLKALGWLPKQLSVFKFIKGPATNSEVQAKVS